VQVVAHALQKGVQQHLQHAEASGMAQDSLLVDAARAAQATLHANLPHISNVSSGAADDQVRMG
jgi:hypothetical protein